MTLVQELRRRRIKQARWPTARGERTESGTTTSERLSCYTSFYQRFQLTFSSPHVHPTSSAPFPLNLRHKTTANESDPFPPSQLPATPSARSSSPEFPSLFVSFWNSTTVSARCQLQVKLLVFTLHQYIHQGPFSSSGLKKNRACQEITF